MQLGQSVRTARDDWFQLEASEEERSHNGAYVMYIQNSKSSLKPFSFGKLRTFSLLKIVCA
jgi:hypothetical protein